MQLKKLLIVDDDLEMLESLKKIMSHKPEYDATYCQEPRIVDELIKKEKFDLVISDLMMNDFNGIDLLISLKKQSKETPIIIISGYGTIEASVESIKLGAFDFIEKPFTSKKLFESIDNALKSTAYADSEIGFEHEIESEYGIIYRSDSMKEIIKMIRSVAPTDMSVLITGESGTGKELVARAIHQLSKSSSDLFIPVNCGALPENLFESELFGYERGAFTGAMKTKPGLLEFANQGTFFFDEIGELSQALQVKLLRMLEDKKIRRIGGQEELDIDVRIIAATNKDLKEEVVKNNFREDLFYRLSIFTIDIPPLRDRIDDIVPLTNHFLKQFCERRNEPEKNISKEVEDALLAYTWPGNIRELQNVIGRSCLLSTNKIIEVVDLPIPLKANHKKFYGDLLALNYSDAKESIIEKFELEYLAFHLKENNGNISQTALKCELDRRTLHRLIKKYNIVY